MANKTVLLDATLHQGHGVFRDAVGGLTISGLIGIPITGWIDHTGRLNTFRMGIHAEMEHSLGPEYVVRFTINSGWLGVEHILREAIRQQAEQEYRVLADDSGERRGTISAEITVHRNEVVAFAGWLPRWLDAKVRGTRVAAPPYPMLEEFPEEHHYQWSKRGWALYQKIQVMKKKKGVK